MKQHAPEEDEFTRECLAIHVARSIRASDVLAVLQRTMHQQGYPQFLRSDNGSEFTATAVRQWLHDQHVGPRFIEPGHPWQNGFIESFHGKFRAECLNREWFTTGHEAMIVIEQGRQAFNMQRPHSALGYQNPRANGGVIDPAIRRNSRLTWYPKREQVR